MVAPDKLADEDLYLEEGKIEADTHPLTSSKAVL